MKRLLTAVFVAVTALSISCNDLGDGGGGGGGGGVNFTRGYVWVNPDSRDVYIANESDVSTSAALTSNGGNQDPAISPTGKQVAFVHHDASGNSEIDVVSTSGGAASTLVPADGSHPNARSPVFSPDGSSVYFVYDNGGTSQLAVVGTTGAGLADITTGSLAYAAPAVAPDGTLVAAAGSSASSLTQIERVDPTSGQATNITNSLPTDVVTIADRISVSPDGSQAVFEARTTSSVTRIFAIDLNNPGTVVQLTDHPGDATANDSYPSYVDASTVAFSSDVGGASQVYTTSSNPPSPQAGTLIIPSAIMPFHGP